ncbi:MAG: carboxypeptidase-like regulatory domain-containing protein [Pirellulaceae bacterium]|nr:carboxypeptidase-like regulatory domain-containing protein [Pirellulaceae bacterium]
MNRASQAVKRVCQATQLVIACAALAMTGCIASNGTVGAFEQFRGQALNQDGAPLANVIVVFQPTERGYEIELETDGEGRFEGEGVPGEYIYYFADSKLSKTKLPKGFPGPYLEPKLEHLVRVQPNADVICRVE